MSWSHDELTVSRRNFLLVIAEVSLFASLPLSYPPPPELDQEIDWDEAVNQVIKDRNAFVVGMMKTQPTYAVGSPEWCVEKDLNASGLVG
jgi:hypothetical protein